MGVLVDYANSLKVDDIDTIYITAAGYYRYPFKGISRDSALGWEEPVWGGDLTRSVDLTLTNIDDVDFGLVARCEVSYKYMNVQDYKVLCEIAKQRTCKVDYYSRDLGKRVEQEMAFTSNELKKLYTLGKEYLGNLDVSIKLVATNRDKIGLIQSTCTITYDSNGGLGTIDKQEANWGGVVVVAEGRELANFGYHLKEFNTKPDGSGGRYFPNQHITLFLDLILYAIWE